jgi:hypothetical protein
MTARIFQSVPTLTPSSARVESPTQYIHFIPGQLISFMRHGKIVRSSAKIVRSTTRQAKISGREIFCGAREKQSTVRHLSLFNFQCSLCCDLTDLSAELQE